MSVKVFCQALLYMSASGKKVRLAPRVGSWVSDSYTGDGSERGPMSFSQVRPKCNTSTPWLSSPGRPCIQLSTPPHQISDRRPAVHIVVSVHPALGREPAWPTWVCCIKQLKSKWHVSSVLRMKQVPIRNTRDISDDDALYRREGPPVFLIGTCFMRDTLSNSTNT